MAERPIAIRWRVARLVRSLFYGPSGTWSLGRIVCGVLLSLMLGQIALFNVLLVWIVASRQMVEAAPLAQAFASVMVAAVSAPAAGLVVSYITAKVTTGGAATVEQVEQRGESLSPGGP